jgi:hypothetical protein
MNERRLISANRVLHAVASGLQLAQEQRSVSKGRLQRQRAPQGRFGVGLTLINCTYAARKARQLRMSIGTPREDDPGADEPHRGDPLSISTSVNAAPAFDVRNVICGKWRKRGGAIRARLLKSQAVGDSAGGALRSREIRRSLSPDMPPSQSCGSNESSSERIQGENPRRFA